MLIVNLTLFVSSVWTGPESKTKIQLQGGLEDFRWCSYPSSNVNVAILMRSATDRLFLKVSLETLPFRSTESLGQAMDSRPFCSTLILDPPDSDCIESGALPGTRVLSSLLLTARALPVCTSFPPHLKRSKPLGIPNTVLITSILYFFFDHRVAGLFVNSWVPPVWEVSVSHRSRIQVQSILQAVWIPVGLRLSAKDIYSILALKMPISNKKRRSNKKRSLMCLQHPRTAAQGVLLT